MLVVDVVEVGCGEGVALVVVVGAKVEVVSVGVALVVVVVGAIVVVVVVDGIWLLAATGFDAAVCILGASVGACTGAGVDSFAG